jgi:hypothetical protein
VIRGSNRRDRRARIVDVPEDLDFVDDFFVFLMCTTDTRSSSVVELLTLECPDLTLLALSYLTLIALLVELSDVDRGLAIE